LLQTDGGQHPPNEILCNQASTTTILILSPLETYCFVVIHIEKVSAIFADSNLKCITQELAPEGLMEIT